jgi:hypothetical protein
MMHTACSDDGRSDRPRFNARHRGWGLASLLALLSWSTPGHTTSPESEPEPAAWQYKFTPSRYTTSGENPGTDLNLRAQAQGNTWWVGHYQRGAEFQQTRFGYERTRPWALGQWTLSVQAATHGFAGGSISSQIGADALHGLVGFGRTNAQTYYNLNFDPNDAWTLGVGGQVLGNNLSVFRVQDNRLNSEQRNTHLLWRWPLAAGQRLTVDYAFKSGHPEAGQPMVSGHSLSLAYNHHPWFIHWVKDQHVNYTQADQIRLSLGWRF